MPKGTYTPNTELLTILKAQGKRTFRVTAIRDLYAQQHQDKRSGNDLRRWVNGQFKTLVKHGYIEVSSQAGVRTDYTVTGKLLSIKHVNSESNRHIEPNKNVDVVNVLKARLRDSKLEMLTCSGETKEYEELSNLLPDLRSQLQTKFNIAKEKNIECIGRIKALELLIAEQS